MTHNQSITPDGNNMILEVRDLHCAINGTAILHGLTFSIERGDRVAIIGPNGAGKSTLLRCLDRIIDFSFGEVLLRGQPVSELTRVDLARQIGYVPQIDRTSPPFTVRQFVEMGRYVHSGPFSTTSSTDRDAIDRAMAMTDTHQFTDRMLDTLSGGERQKVHIAAALAQETEILLLDEPTSFLDYRHQAEIGQLLKQVNCEHGTTIVTVTHDVNRAVLESRHLIAMKGGRIVCEGTPDELINQKTLHAIYDVDFNVVRPEGTDRPMIVPPI